MALQFNMSAPGGSKSKQFNASQGQYLTNLSGYGNQAAVGAQNAMEGPHGINNEINRYTMATGDLAGLGTANLQHFIDNPGYTPQEQQGMRMATTMPIASAMNTAAYQNRADAARTGQGGGMMAANAAIARERARQLTSGLSGLQTNIANARREDVMGGINAAPTMLNSVSNAFQFPSTLQAGLYNTNMGAQNDALQGQLAATQMYQQRAAQPGFLKQAALTGISGLTSGAAGLLKPKAQGGLI